MRLKPMDRPICDGCDWKTGKNEKRAIAQHRVNLAYVRIIVNGAGGHGWPGIYDMCGPHGSEKLRYLEKSGLTLNVDYGVDPVFWDRLEEEYRGMRDPHQRHLAV